MTTQPRDAVPLHVGPQVIWEEALAHRRIALHDEDVVAARRVPEMHMGIDDHGVGSVMCGRPYQKPLGRGCTKASNSSSSSDTLRGPSNTLPTCGLRVTNS